LGQALASPGAFSTAKHHCRRLATPPGAAKRPPGASGTARHRADSWGTGPRAARPLGRQGLPAPLPGTASLCFRLSFRRPCQFGRAPPFGARRVARPPRNPGPSRLIAQHAPLFLARQLSAVRCVPFLPYLPCPLSAGAARRVGPLRAGGARPSPFSQLHLAEMGGPLDACLRARVAAALSCRALTPLVLCTARRLVSPGL
jgi:hypothetical protein